MTSDAERGDRRTDVDAKAIVVGQVAVLVAFVITWIATGFDYTSGRDLSDAATFVGILASLPAFLTGFIAGLAAHRRPRLRRMLLIGFAVLLGVTAGALYAFGTPRCAGQGDALVILRPTPVCGPSWKDAVGIFLGAEFAIAFQAVIAWIFAGIARKYPLRRPTL